jgi:hypothetical protein
LQLTEEQKQILNLSIYTICYVKTFVKKGDKDGKFISWNNNFANVELNVFYGESTNNFEPTYCCININAKSKSTANFENLDKFLNFMVDRIKNNIERIKQEGLIKYYVCNWPTNDNNPSAEYFENNKNQFQTVLDIITKAAISASSVGIK